MKRGLRFLFFRNEISKCFKDGNFVAAGMIKRVID